MLQCGLSEVSHFFLSNVTRELKTRVQLVMLMYAVPDSTVRNREGQKDIEPMGFHFLPWLKNIHKFYENRPIFFVNPSHAACYLSCCPCLVSSNAENHFFCGELCARGHPIHVLFLSTVQHESTALMIRACRHWCANQQSK